MELLFLSAFFIGMASAASEISLRFVFIIEAQDRDLAGAISRALKDVEASSPGVKLDDEVVLLDREDEDLSYRMLCSALSKGVTAIVDVSWSPWEAAAGAVRGAAHAQPLLSALDQYLRYRNATDAAIIVPTERDVDRALYRLLGASGTRVLTHAGLSRESARALRNMRPEPEFFAVVGPTNFVMDTYARAVKEKLVRRAHRWNLVFTDYPGSNLDLSSLILPTTILYVDESECCKLSGGEDCACPSDAQRPQAILTAIIRQLTSTASKLDPPLSPRESCEESTRNTSSLPQQLAEDVADNRTVLYWDPDRSSLELRSRFVLSTFSPDEGLTQLAGWTAEEQFRLLPGVTLQPLRMFFRIGTSTAVPWTMPKLDPESGVQLVTEEGQPQYEGYCIDLIARLSETMGFDYEIVTPKSGGFGRKLDNGTWDGVVGDLMLGETDMAVGALTMTAEREEVIDFVPPYFEQTGILIVIRKPTRKTSLFKFMTVLRTEVWVSIVAALVCTALMIWLLDRHSPYSARNNPDAYPYPCREFTLKESFWFALTSFTPQGGGEAPKALSGRTLVAAYWLFVVLMLATFTANLAAFLTVERMQTPVSSLEQLARQSRINYTVVEGSTVHQYFINMKFAEDTLYRVWKEITLNATSDQAQYRVWDYPIREQYGHILLAINASGPVADAKTGFEQVNEHTDADFAFIHDSAEIRFEMTRNCNLTEVGEVFAEQPYAIGVQQGSRLQEELSRALLELQKERFLEQLAAKYWNETARQSCPDADESEGITLESLGGVFIATLFGLGLAMITLAWEVFYYKRKEKNKVQALDTSIEKPEPFGEKKGIGMITESVARLRKREKRGKTKQVTIGKSFKAAAEKPAVSYISVYPKNEFRP
uniref:Ionotropic receptor n=1 Tax=Semiothisa cinerearia TaxID=2249628 RepID=A0A889XLW6_9NEOP|nr:ionotropic receptor [Semiothisa cinerearia]